MPRVALVSLPLPGVVKSTIIADADFVPSDKTLSAVQSDTANVGDTYDGSSFKAPASTASLSDMAGTLNGAASYACDSVRNQVAPDQTHLVAFQNGYAAVMASGGQAPTTEPLKTAFADQAAAYGKAVADFAPLVISIGAASLQLSAALATVQAATAAAKAVPDLAAALENFENSLAGIVGLITEAGLTVTAPAAILIAGVNA